MAPAGRPPTQAVQNVVGDETCSAISGTFKEGGLITRDGGRITEVGASAHSLLSGCHSPKECRWPVLRKSPGFFSIHATLETGFRAELQDSKSQVFGVLKLPPTRLSCTNDGLAIELHNGMAKDGPGAWTIGYEKLTVVLMKQSDGTLVAKRERKRFDLFWFGLPFVSGDGFWLLYEPSPGNASTSGH